MNMKLREKKIKNRQSKKCTLECKICKRVQYLKEWRNKRTYNKRLQKISKSAIFKFRTKFLFKEYRDKVLKTLTSRKGIWFLPSFVAYL